MIMKMCTSIMLEAGQNKMTKGIFVFLIPQ